MQGTINNMETVYSENCVCDQCGQELKSQRTLSNHQRRKHSDMFPFKCSLCTKSFNVKSDFTRHLRTHTGEKPYACEECNKTFVSSSDITRHRKTHSTVKMFKCKICPNKQFAQRSGLTLHTQLVHMGTVKMYDCDVCHKKFKTSGSLKEHKMTHLKRVQIPCKLCNKTFLTNTGLKRHLQSHLNENHFECQYCNLSYTHEGSLVRHMKSVHTATVNRRHECNQCQKNFSSQESLKYHAKRVHNRLTEAACVFCEKIFSTKYHLFEHYTSEIGEKPFSCSLCGRSFGSNGILRKHILYSHTKEKRYRCGVCNFKWVQEWEVTRHSKANHGEMKPIIIRCKY